MYYELLEIFVKITSNQNCTTRPNKQLIPYIGVQENSSANIHKMKSDESGIDSSKESWQYGFDKRNGENNKTTLCVLPAKNQMGQNQISL